MSRAVTLSFPVSSFFDAEELCSRGAHEKAKSRHHRFARGPCGPDRVCLAGLGFYPVRLGIRGCRRRYDAERLDAERRLEQLRAAVFLGQRDRHVLYWENGRLARDRAL